MHSTPAHIEPIKRRLHAVLAERSGLAFAVLVGSQADGTAHEASDWDIAIRWTKITPGTDKLLVTEELRQDLSQILQVRDDQIDLIDLSDARLAMRALVAEEGIPLYIADDLAWVRFLQNTWAQLEDNQWGKHHAA